MSDVDSSLLCHSAASRASSFASAARRASAAAHARRRSAPTKPSASSRKAKGHSRALRLGADELRRNRERRTRTMFAKVRSHTCVTQVVVVTRVVAEFGSVRLFRDASRRRPPPSQTRVSRSQTRAFFRAFFRELVVWNEPEALEPVRVASSRRSLVDQSLGERSLGERRERLGRRAPQKRRPLDERARGGFGDAPFRGKFWKKFSSPKSATPRLVRSYRNRRASRTCTVAAIVRASQTYRSRHARDGTTRAYAPTDSAATHSTYAAKIERVSKTFSPSRAKTSSRKRENAFGSAGSAGSASSSGSFDTERHGKHAASSLSSPRRACARQTTTCGEHGCAPDMASGLR